MLHLVILLRLCYIGHRCAVGSGHVDRSHVSEAYRCVAEASAYSLFHKCSDLGESQLVMLRQLCHVKLRCGVALAHVDVIHVT